MWTAILLPSAISTDPPISAFHARPPSPSPMDNASRTTPPASTTIPPMIASASHVASEPRSGIMSASEPSTAIPLLRAPAPPASRDLRSEEASALTIPVIAQQWAVTESALPVRAVSDW